MRELSVLFGETERPGAGWPHVGKPGTSLPVTVRRLPPPGQETIS